MIRYNFIFTLSLFLTSFTYGNLHFSPTEIVSTAQPLEDQSKPHEITPPLGLPPIPWPEGNPYSKEKADLGRILFFDKRLSSDQTISCASCHSVSFACGDSKPVSEGINGAMGTRNSPALVNSAYNQPFFWDGRAQTLEEQCEGPLANPMEMTTAQDPHEAHKECVERVREIAGYQALFENAFDSNEITMEKIAQAISTFERTILSGNSPYDRYAAGDTTALSEKEIRGFAVFSQSNCIICHSGFNFTGNRFNNIGIGMDALQPDLGRYTITQNEKDWGAFKTPTLRELEYSGPYMHDGSLKTLEEVVDFYDKGGIKNKNLNPLIHPLNLSSEDKNDLVLFLKALGGEGWQGIEEPEQFPE